jgi:hypothetical protein
MLTSWFSSINSNAVDLGIITGGNPNSSYDILSISGAFTNFLGYAFLTTPLYTEDYEDVVGFMVAGIQLMSAGSLMWSLGLEGKTISWKNNYNREYSSEHANVRGH